MRTRSGSPFDTLLERGIAFLLLGAAGWGAVAFGGVRATEFGVATGLVLLAWVAWVVRLWATPSHRLLLTPLLLPVVGFVGYAAWRTTGVAVPYLARQELWWLGVYAVVFVLALHNLHGQETTTWVAHLLVALGSLLSLYAVMQWLGGSDRVLWMVRPEGYARRAGATFVNPNHLAGFLVQLLPLALGQVFLGRAKAGAWKAFHGYAAGMMLLGIASTMSRGGWLATAVVLALFFTWLGVRRRHLRLASISCAGVILIGAGLFLMFNEKARSRVEGAGTEGHQESGLRTYIWKPALRMWHDHAWTGVGPGQFDVHFPAYRPIPVQVSPRYTHNEYLNTLVDYGVLGAAIAWLGVGGLVATVLYARKYAERGGSDLGSRGSNRTAFFLGSTLGLTGLAVHCGTDFLLHVPGVALTATVLSAMLASQVRFATERFWLKPAPWGRLLVTLAAAGVVAGIAPLALLYAREGRHLNRAEARGSLSPELIADLKAAAAVMPDNPRTAYEIGENLRRISLRGLDGWEGQAREALEWLGKSAAGNPLAAHPHLAASLAWHWLGDLEQAQREMLEARRRGPHDLLIQNHHGWLLLQQGRTGQARAVFAESLEWNWWDNWMARKYLEEIDAGLWPEGGRPAGNPAAGPAPGSR